MTNLNSYFERMIDGKLLNIHTAYLARVVSVSGTQARLQPLSVYKAVGGNAQEQSTTTAVIPPNIKSKAQTITYRMSETESESTTVLIPEVLSAGDIVYVGVCDRDISNAKLGEVGEATNRHHNINDGVILQVVR